MRPRSPWSGCRWGIAACDAGDIVPDLHGTRDLDVSDLFLDRLELFLDRRQPHILVRQFRAELVHELQDEIGIFFRHLWLRWRARRRRDLDAFDSSQQARHDHRHLVPRHRPIAFERPVGIALDQALGGQLGERLVGPVVRRGVGKRLRDAGRGGPTDQQNRHSQGEQPHGTPLQRGFA